MPRIPGPERPLKAPQRQLLPNPLFKKKLKSTARLTQYR